MMRPRASLSGLKKTRAWEYAVRFVFGGVITALAGWVGARHGPAVGGMMLAFPAILPASLTLVKRHDGRQHALDDARGSRVGAVALAAFAVVVAVTAERWPAALFLPIALAVWTAIACALWRVLLAR